MVLIKAILKPLKLLLFLAIILGALKATLSVVIIGFVSKFMDPAFSSETKNFYYLFILVGIAFFIGVASNLAMVKLSGTLAYSLRKKLAEKVLKASYTDVERVGDARIKVILNNDTVTVTDACAVLPDLVFNFCFIVLALCYLAWRDFLMFCVLAFCMIIGIGIILALVKFMRFYDQIIRETQDDYQVYIESLSLGMKEMGLNKHRRSFFYKKVFLPTLERYRDSEIRGNTYGYLANNCSETLILLSLSFMILFAFKFNESSLGVLASFILIIIFLRGPLANFISSIPKINKARVALAKMADITSFIDFNNIEETQNENLDKKFTLSLKDVKFSYPAVDDSQPFTVGPVDLAFNAGEVIFIIGGNGSGKSTLLKLISGLYMPAEGTVQIGHLLSATETYRDQFSAIFSDYYLMRHVIDEHGSAVTQLQAAELLKALYLEDKVSVADGMLSSINLSQGQKKRLAMLISVFENKNIIIFDEWAADQDPYFKDIFYSQILPDLKNKGKLVIVVSHDEQYFNRADRIFKLNGGQLMSLSLKDVSHDFIKFQFNRHYEKQAATTTIAGDIK